MENLTFKDSQCFKQTQTVQEDHRLLTREWSWIRLEMGCTLPDCPAVCWSAHRERLECPSDSATKCIDDRLTPTHWVLSTDSHSYSVRLKRFRRKTCIFKMFYSLDHSCKNIGFGIKTFKSMFLYFNKNMKKHRIITDRHQLHNKCL